MLTVELFGLQEEIGQEIKSRESKIKSLQKSKEQVYQKIDKFFHELAQQMEIRKSQLKKEYDLVIEPQIKIERGMSEKFEQWQEQAAEVESLLLQTLRQIQKAQTRKFGDS